MKKAVRRYRAIVADLNELAQAATLGAYVPLVKDTQGILLPRMGHEVREGTLISVSFTMETIGITFEGVQEQPRWGFGCCNPNCGGKDQLPLGCDWHQQVFEIIERHEVWREEVVKVILAKKPAGERPQTCGGIWYPRSVLEVVAELL